MGESILIQRTPTASKLCIARDQTGIKDTDNNCPDTEFHFLLNCLKVFLNSSLHPLISAKQLDAITWTRLESLVYAHRLLPVIHQVLHKTDLIQTLPDQAAKTLVAEQQQMTQRNLTLSAIAAKLLKALQKHNIRALPLKGSLLGLQIYNNLTLRTPGDIDLLIEASQLDRTLNILEPLGFRWLQAEGWTPTQKRLFIAQQGEISCISKDQSVRVDLHIRWSGTAQLFTLPFEQAWKSAIPLPLSSAYSPLTLCLEHQMLYLCIHGAKHTWERLSWLLDIGMLIQQPINWETVNAEAKRLDIQRPVKQALHLAQDLLDAEIPNTFTENDHTSISWLTKVVKTKIKDNQSKSLPHHFRTLPTKPLEMLHRIRYQMKLKSSIRYKFAYFQRLFISSTDWQVINLPEPLWFLHVPLRPVLYIWRLIYYLNK